MNSTIKHGFCLYLTVEEFFTEYVKNNSLENVEVIIVSRDVQADIKVKENYNHITYDSKYDNVDFVPSLLPTPATFEFAYSQDDDRFVEIYEGHLLSDDVMMDLTCIVDMIVNDGVDVILLSSRSEYKSKFPWYLKDFVYERFGLKICLSEQLSEAENDDDYLKLIDDIGDVDEIRTMVEYNKIQLTEDKRSSDDFFNKFMEDAPTKYRKILMTKDIDYIIKLGNEKGLRLSRRNNTKEKMVDEIVKEIFGET